VLRRGCTANRASSLWLPAGQTLQTALLTVLKTALLFIVSIVVLIESIRLVGSLRTPNYAAEDKNPLHVNFVSREGPGAPHVPMTKAVELSE
jgi:hypothetical protein